MIPLFKVFMSQDVLEHIASVINSGFIGEGPKNLLFEEELKRTLDYQNILTLNSGTSALHLAYHLAINHDRDAEIITPSMTCSATNVPIVANGARIVWADIDPISGNIDPNHLESLITKKTKAITVVHWGGNPADLDKINQIAHKYNIKVIEDAAHAIGATYKGKKIGCHSDYIAFSFQAIKHLTTIDGGALAIRFNDDFKRAKLLRWFGIDRNASSKHDLRCEIDVKEAGYKFHMNDVNASVGLSNIKFLDDLIAKHRINAQYFNLEFSRYQGKIKLANQTANSESSYWLYTIHVDNRDELMARLSQEGIMSSKVHSPNHRHTMFANFKRHLPATDIFEKTHLCIPVGWWLTEDDRQKIVEKVIRYAK